MFYVVVVEDKRGNAVADRKLLIENTTGKFDYR